jgi:hypothetical protein
VRTNQRSDWRARRSLERRKHAPDGLLGFGAALILGIDDTVKAVRDRGDEQRELVPTTGRALAQGARLSVRCAHRVGDDQDFGLWACGADLGLHRVDVVGNSLRDRQAPGLTGRR